MTPLIWMVTWIVQSHAEMWGLPAPINVTISSKHFVHILTWQPGPGSPKDVSYNVTVNTLKQNSWEPVPGCQHVVFPLVCNVTNAYPVRSETYYNQVIAVLGEQVSNPALQKGFKPIQDTHLDPPLVFLSACGKTLCVGLLPPVEGLGDFYNNLSYNLKVWSTSMDIGLFSVDTHSLREKPLQDLAPDREYCVAARIADRLERRESSYSQSRCAHTAALGTSGAVFAAMVCLVMVILAVGLKLIHPEFVILLGSVPVLPFVHHHETMLVAVLSSDLFSTLHVEALPPPAGDEENTRHNQEESGDETREGDGSGGDGAGYEGRVTAASPFEDPLSSSSSCSSSSCVAPLLPRPCLNTPIPGPTGVLPTEAQADSKSIHSQPAVYVPGRQAEPAYRAGRPSSNLPNSSLSSSISSTVQCPELVQCPFQSPPIDTGRNMVAVERVGVEEEDEEWSQDVNLLSVSLAGHWGEQGGVTAAGHGEAMVDDPGPVDPGNMEESVEEEEEECSGYMKR